MRDLPPRLTTLPPEVAARVTWAAFDLEDPARVQALVRDHPAAEIFHLAAFTSVGRSWSDAAAAFRVNAIGTLFLLQAVAAARETGAGDPRILVVGSAEAYGASAQAGRPLAEDAPLRPLSPYAVSKAAQEMLALQAHRASGLWAVVARSFNHTGPGQRPPFAAGEFALQLRAAKRAGAPARIAVGNLDARRDFTDVRDVARAYRLLIERGEAGRVYNVCRGEAVSLREILLRLAEIAGVRAEPVVEPGHLRPVDLPEVVGDPAALAAATGWHPQVDLRRSLEDLWNDLWRE